MARGYSKADWDRLNGMLDEFAMVQRTWADPDARARQRSKLYPTPLAVLVLLETLGSQDPTVTWVEAEDRLGRGRDTLRQAAYRLAEEELIEPWVIGDPEGRRLFGMTARERFRGVTPAGRRLVWALLEQRGNVLSQERRERGDRHYPPVPSGSFNEQGDVTF